MDDKINIIENFETILKESRKNIISSLYNNVKVSTKHTNRPQDVIKLVSSQMKAIQMADRVYEKDLQRHNKTKIIDDKSAVNKVIPRKNMVNKFETQCVSDTQLIDVVKMAEAFDNCGTTQDLDISITVSDLEKMYEVNDGPSRDPEGNSIENEDAEVFPKGVDSVLTDNAAIETTFVGFTEDFDIETDKVLGNENNKIINECIGVDGFDELERDRSVSLSPILNRKEQSNAVKDSVLKERDKKRSESPVFNVKGVKKSKSPQPLVFSLESFEKFEQIAIPLIEENEDLETAKHLINSQILDKELFLPSKCNNEILINWQSSGKENEGAGSNIVPNNDKGEDTEADNIDKDIKPRLFDDKTSSILEDEILFSSDEENYEHKEIQDLPFTCALETSFYEQSDILDKTVYVGFQTASNKTIQVNTESFNKAKSLLSEIEPSVKKELTLTELVHICDMSKNDEFNKQRAISPEILSEGDDSIEIPDISISTLNKLAGTAIKEIDLNDPGPEKENNTQFPDMYMLNSAICNLPQEKDNDKRIKEDTKHSLELISKLETPSKGVFEGFKTASKKIIKLSDAALARCQKVFQDIDLDTKYDETDKNILPDTKITVISEQDKEDNKVENSNDDDIQADINDESILQEFENIEMSIGNDNSVKLDKPSFVGFKTANDKNIKVSIEAAEKAKRLFEDIEKDLLNSKVKKDYPTIEISEPNYSDSIRNNNNFKETINIGFKTASNKNIKISEQALAKTKTLFQDIKLDDVEIEKSNSKGDKPLTNEKEITRKVGDDKLIFEDFNQPSTSKDFLGTNNDYNKINISDNNPVYKTGVIKPEFGGFKTASNKKVKISEEALVRSKKLFSDISDTNLGCNLDDLKDNKPIPHLAGFQTANKKPINISAETLDRSKKIFQEEIPEANQDITENVKQIPNVVGFQTANNKPVHISTKALERSRKLFKEEIPESNQDIPENVKSIPTVVGFKTSNQKPVSISSEALAKSKKILDDFDAIQFDHKEEMVRDDLVPEQETNQIPSDIHFDTANDCVYKSTGLEGFRTASKKEVNISNEALEKCKSIFQDIVFTENFSDNDYTTRKLDNNDKKETMCGFKTASNKVVSISAASLASSKRLFEDIDDEDTTKNADKAKVCYSEYKKSDSRKPTTNENVDITKVTNFGGFKTANNKQVKVSEQALAITKDIFKDIDNVTKDNDIKATKDQEPRHIVENAAKRFKTSKDLKETITKENIEDIIDTQVLNNFETTLHTEDFHQVTTKTNKRSGSPILACPRAKRMRFETPYRTNKLSKIDIPEPIQEKKEIFTENYKKNKIYRLKDLTVYNTNTVDSYLTNFDYDTLLNFEFFGVRNDLTSTKMNVESIKELFLSSVNKKLIPLGWLENHIKLILWKLISYDVKFSLGVCTARNLINQLKYRYDRELYNAERPALRKILEKDDVASKTIVLCVVAIFDGGVKVDNVATTANIELLLTDGWYCVMTTTDKMLTRLVKERKIVVGSKISTNGAELMNCDQGVAPWEDTSSVRLKIFGNSTRRARWDARLGYHGNGAILSHLSNVKLDGGKVSKLRVYVARVYPALYVEKFDDGSTVTRSERLEHLHQIKYEAERQILMEKLYEEVEKEFSDQDSQGSENICDNRTSLQSGSQIFEALKRSKDPSDFRSHLTSSQTKLLEGHEGKRRERLVERAQARILDKMERDGLRRGRNVVTVLKVRVAGVNKNGVCKGLLSIWKPNDSLMELIKEDTWIEVLNVVPTAVRYSEIQLSAGRQSVFLQSKFKETDRNYVTTALRRKCYTIKELNTQITTEYNEVDTAGIIFSIEPSLKEFNNKSQFQNVYLTDKECNIICVNFWGGLQKFGYQILDTGQIVAGINLQKRAGNTRNMPHYRVTEFSYFTKTPKNSQAKGIVDDLNKISVLDRRRICEECIKLKNNFAAKGNVNITPYRMNNVDLSRNKAFLDSVERITHSEFNLTGLDFESTFKQQEELSPKTLKRKREVNNRINKLKMYGEPPPLTPIHIINKSVSAMNSYKSPLTNDISPSVARIKNIMNISRNSDNIALNSSKNSNSKIDISVASDKFEKGNIKDSPVTSLNKTYVKSSVNPVKLNFDNASDVDQFAEEFEASPPLSLD